MALSQHQPVAPGVLDQPAAGVHQPLLQAGQRPVPDLLRQRQPPPQIIGDCSKRKSGSNRSACTVNEWEFTQGAPRFYPLRLAARRRRCFGAAVDRSIGKPAGAFQVRRPEWAGSDAIPDRRETMGPKSNAGGSKDLWLQELDLFLRG